MEQKVEFRYNEYQKNSFEHLAPPKALLEGYEPEKSRFYGFEKKNKKKLFSKKF